MPGIVGLITQKPRQQAERELQQMLASIHHDSAHITGTWVDEATGVYVGWTARKGSFADTMPLCNERGDIALIFAGEEYSGAEVRQTLQSRGHHVGDGPSYLVHLYEDDPSFPANLNGRFQGLLIDKTRRTVMLFDDRYAMHRVYYHEAGDAFYFSVEAKAILKVRPELRSMDYRGVGEFVSTGCVLENRTIFKGIEVLPPASAWIFRDGKLAQKGEYFHPSEWENQTPLTSEKYYEELRQVFSRILPRYFSGSERVAVSLTGGLDTRMIMAWWKPAPQSLPCYTFGGPFRDCQDVILARRIAAHCGQNHQVIPISDDFLKNFPQYAERAVYLSDGCTAVNRAADLYANEIAGQIAPIRMTGNYGSEILRRLRAFKPGDPAAGLFQQEFLVYVDEAKKTYARQVEGHAVSFTAFRQAPWYQYGLLALEQTQLTLRSPYLDNDLVRTAFRAPNSGIVKSDIFEDNDDCVRLIADGDQALRNIPTDRGLGGAPGSWTAPISRAFLEFTFKAEYAYDYGMPQWLARIDHALSPLHLERLFLGRHKLCPFRVWYRDSLSDYVREVLLDSRTLSRPFVQKNVVETMVRHHLKGDRNYTTEIHRLLTLELQHRLFIEAN